MLRGDIRAIIEPGPDRTKPPCPHYDDCGGCALQHISDSAYQDWKQASVLETLTRRGLQPDEVLPPVFIPQGTRRRATFALFKRSGKLLCGYHKRRSHIVTDIAECLVLDPDLLTLRAALIPHLAKIVKDSHPADLFIQKAGGDFDIVITGPVGRDKSGAPDLAVREAVAAMAEQCDIARIGWRRRERDMIEPLIQRRPVLAAMGTLQVELPHGAFMQPSQAGQKALTDAIMAALPDEGRFADLFAGCGTFAGPMLTKGPVDSFESEEAAVAALHKAAGGLSLNAAQRDLFHDALTPKELAAYSAVVLDPPRAGAKEQAAELAASDVPVIIYVSCNPASFARDAARLVEGGYRFASIQMFDQFTWSTHSEIIGVFQKG